MVLPVRFAMCAVPVDTDLTVKFWPFMLKVDVVAVSTPYRSTAVPSVELLPAVSVKLFKDRVILEV